MQWFLVRVASLSVAMLLTQLETGMAQTESPVLRIDFARDVQPLFADHCIECHGPDQQMNGFRLDRRRDAMKGGTASMIGPGNSQGSRLYLKLIGTEFGPQMPPNEPLAAEKIAVIKAWIDQGAVWPDDFSGEKPPSIPDPLADKISYALRRGDLDTFRRMLRDVPQVVELKGLGGTTPLMAAVLYGDVESVRLLLEAGADPNEANDAGATALMWAIDDLDKTRLLLRHHADVNAKSIDGRTPLLSAAARPGSYDVVKWLLDHGANPSQSVATYRGPMNPLRMAAEAGDDAMLQLLLERGADAQEFGGVFPLVAAINVKDKRCIQLTMPSAIKAALQSTGIFVVPPFGSPAALQDPFAIRTLFTSGADITVRDSAGRTVLMLAASSENTTEEIVETLVELGAEVNAVATDGRTALDFALQLGKTPVVEFLQQLGAQSGVAYSRPMPEPKPARSAREAVERSLPLLQMADVTFLKKSGCVSCHHNSLTAITVAAARHGGIPVDEESVCFERQAVGTYIESWRERVLQGMGVPGDSNTINYLLAGLAAEHYPPDPATDAMARYLKNDQMPDGRWRLVGTRPPLNASEFELTAVAMLALQAYAPKSQAADYQRPIWRAADWLRSNQPETTTDRAFQLLGLTWAGDHPDLLRNAAEALVAQQRADGGWGQVASMASDAYATGQSLAALQQSGAIATTSEVYERGVAYLLSTQLEDGSWHVNSRSIPFQPYFESGFPHGRDQWISAAATNWATIALIPLAR